MDEILSVGDIDFQQKSRQTFFEFKKKKKTIVLVTHDLDTIKKNCDRAMFLNEGKIESIGEPSKVIESYCVHTYLLQNTSVLARHNDTSS